MLKKWIKKVNKMDTRSQTGELEKPTKQELCAQSKIVFALH